MNFFVICSMFLSVSIIVYANQSIDTAKNYVENIQAVAEKIASKKLIESTKQVAELVEISKVLSPEKIEKMTKFIEKILDNDKLEKLAKVAGPAGDALILALSLFSEETEDRFDKYFKEVIEKIDALDSKLDVISEKVRKSDCVKKS